MTSLRRRAAVLAASGSLAVTGAPLARADGAAVAVPADATRAVARCSGGPGSLSVTVLPRGEGSFRMSVVARRVRNDDSQWRAELVAFARNGEEVATTFRRRPVDRSWSFTTDVSFEAATAASFLVDARRLRQDGTTDDSCVVGNSPARPEGAFTACGRGIQVLSLRPQDDGTLLARHDLFSVTAHRRWRLQLEVVSEDRGEGSATTGTTNRNGVIRSETQLGDVGTYEDSVFTATAESSRGRRCWVRLDPGTLV